MAGLRVRSEIKWVVGLRRSFSDKFPLPFDAPWQRPRGRSYTDKQNEEGGFDSGQFGSGVAIVSLALAAVSLLIYSSQILSYMGSGGEEEREKDKNA